MSSSKPETAIYLTDSDKMVRDKVKKHAFSGGRDTVEEHRRLGGNADVDVPFQWLYMLFERDDKRIEQIRTEYRSGRMLSGELKKILIDKISEFLEEHRKRRDKAHKTVSLLKHDGALAKEMWTRDFSKV